MDAGVLDMLHDAADDDRLAVGDRVDVDLDRALQVAIDQQRMALARQQRVRDVAAEVGLVGDDLHRAAAEHIRGANQDRIADCVGGSDRIVEAAHEHALGLSQPELVHQLIEALAILGAIDCIGRRAENRHPRFGQRHRELQRSLAAELHDDAGGLLALDNRHHVLEGERLEIEAIGNS